MVKTAKWLFAAVVLLGAGATWAGAKWNNYLDVAVGSDGSGVAWGDLYTVRAQDGNVYIGCYVVSDPGYQAGLCEAFDGATWFYCFTQDPTVLSGILGIPDTSGALQFNWDSNNNCTRVFADKSSGWSPKVP